MNPNRPPQTKVWRLNKVDRVGNSTSRSLRIARWECWCYHPTLLSPSASFILGEKKWKVKNVGVDCGKKSIEVVRINSENSLERRQFSTTESGIEVVT
ncbi:hypothetical protein FH587_18050 [Leptospira interrogans]|uniref:hypothetical protein n=1 Tax=Leptospira interrogans TaxID=173 RepID=UPI001F073E68|nr:hypothetical protein [Leptospira interrogans]UML86661.1 hypothetical protein FH587_18050 [Leptospira interrogans]